MSSQSRILAATDRLAVSSASVQSDSHTLVRAMGGSIGVETQAGQGTTMTMVLPCQRVMEKAS